MRTIVSRFLIVTLALGFYPSAANAANVSVNVDYTNPRQTVEGFGASATWVANDLDSVCMSWASSAVSSGPVSVMLFSTSSDATLQVTAVRPASGSVTVVLANTGKTSHTVTVNLTGTAPPASVTPYRTSANENQAQLSPINVAAGAFTITVPAKSIVTVVG